VDAAPKALAGKYQPFATLGEGGMAQVFLAVARGPMGFNKLVVLKRMRSQLAQDAGLVTMFLDEARLAARLGHPNVVHTYEVGEQAGLFFIAMEYLEGQPLNRVLAEARRQGRAVDPGVWVRIVCDALAGLHYAHELKDYDGSPLRVVHRDVSPHNVFVTYDGQVKVVDFGIAKAALSQTQTGVGVLKGKVAYMSPEQASGQKVDRRADVFAVGIVLWELITGHKLFAHEYAATTLHKLLDEPTPRMSAVLPEIDHELDDLVARALERDPELRFQSALEMREALETWARAHGGLVRQDDVGRLVTEMFADVRDAVQKQIHSHMAAVAADAGTDPHTPSGNVRWHDSGVLPAIEVHHAPGRSGSAVVRQAPARASGGPAAERRRRTVTLLVAGMLVGGLIAAAFIVPRVVAHTGAVAAGPQSSASPGQAQAQPSSVSAPVVPASAREVASEPSSATASSTAPSAASTPTASPTSSAITQGPVPSPRPANPLVPQGAGAPTAQTATAAPEPGYLSFDTYPWTRVSEGGRMLGETPLMRVSLTPGVHVLTLDNADRNIHRTFTVTIKSGETSSHRLGLE
jgi:serine/threonine-protein kinase